MTPVEIPAMREPSLRLTRWRVAVGEVVVPGQPLFELESDKVVYEVTATEGGRVAAQTVPEGAAVRDRQVVAWLTPG